MKKTGIIIASVVAAVLIAFAVYDGIFSKETSTDFFAMDTVVSLKITGKNSAASAERIKEEINLLDSDILSRHNAASLVSKLNSGNTVNNAEFAAYIKELISVSQYSGGAFDFTLGALSDLWGFGSEPRVPDKTDIDKILLNSGYKKILVNGDSITVDGKRTVVDLGASGKGIALDRAKEILETEKAKKAVISVGGSILLYGDGEFTVGIRKPDGNVGEYIAVIKTKAACVSTSGNYERYFEEGGKRYHHILDPKSGFPAENGVVSVTVISESGLLSDALSTACFVLGVEKGSGLAEKFGCEAVFVTDDKNIYATDGAKQMLTVNADGYTLAE